MSSKMKNSFTAFNLVFMISIFFWDTLKRKTFLQLGWNSQNFLFLFETFLAYLMMIFFTYSLKFFCETLVTRNILGEKYLCVRGMEILNTQSWLWQISLDLSFWIKFAKLLKNNWNDNFVKSRSLFN
jgi:hypothetical protein